MAGHGPFERFLLVAGLTVGMTALAAFLFTVFGERMKELEPTPLSRHLDRWLSRWYAPIVVSTAYVLFIHLPYMVLRKIPVGLSSEMALIMCLGQLLLYATGCMVAMLIMRRKPVAPYWPLVGTFFAAAFGVAWMHEVMGIYRCS